MSQFIDEEWRGNPLKKLVILAAMAVMIFAQAPNVEAASCAEKVYNYCNYYGPNAQDNNVTNCKIKCESG